MDRYMETTVAGKRTTAARVLYIVYWAMIVISLVVAVMLAANILDTSDGAMNIRWLNLLLAAGCVVFALFCFRRKDYLYIDYDYACREGVFEICAVLNRRKRRQIMEISLDRVSRAGIADAAVRGDQTSVLKKFCADNGNHFLSYTENGKRYTALVDFNDEFAAFIRSQLPGGTWHETEGKK